MKKTPSYLRARIAVIEELIRMAKVDREEKNNDRIVLRNGIFPEGFDEEKLVTAKLKNHIFSNTTLDFFELTRYNTWFALYPKKIAGKEYVTSSNEFPISVKGKREDIINMIKTDLKSKNETNDNQDFMFKISLKRKRAKSKLKLMRLTVKL